MKHTQGEWKVRFFGNANKDDGENMFFVEAPNLNMPNLGYGIEILGDDFGDHNGYPREQRLSDAKLIAVAPEMLNLLKIIRMGLDHSTFAGIKMANSIDGLFNKL